jgi:hypothetical protein
VEGFAAEDMLINIGLSQIIAPFSMERDECSAMILRTHSTIATITAGQCVCDSAIC